MKDRIGQVWEASTTLVFAVVGAPTESEPGLFYHPVLVLVPDGPEPFTFWREDELLNLPWESNSWMKRIA